MLYTDRVIFNGIKYSLHLTELIIKDWATVNKMIINMSKTKELVFYRPHPSRSHMPLAVDNIEQVN